MTNHLSAAEVAKRLSVAPSTVYRLVNAGKFPQPRKIGKLSRWPETDLNDYVAGLERGLS